MNDSKVIMIMVVEMIIRMMMRISEKDSDDEIK